MSSRLTLVVAMVTIVASRDQTEYAKCSHRCNFNGRSIISCVGEVSNEDILPCYNEYKQATILDLSLCQMPNISQDLFSDLDRLRHIYMDFVETDSVMLTSFSELRNLKSISLRGVGPERLDMFLAAVMNSDAFLAVNLDGNYENCSTQWLSIVYYLTKAHIMIEHSRFTPHCKNVKRPLANITTETVIHHDGPPKKATTKQRKSANEANRDTQTKRDTTVKQTAPATSKSPGIYAGIAIGSLVIIVILAALVRVCGKKWKTRRDKANGEPQRVYGEKNKKIREKDRFGAFTKALNLKRSESEIRMVSFALIDLKKSKSTDLDELRINEETRQDFLEKMAIRKSFHSRSDSDDAEEDDDDVAPITGTTQTPSTSANDSTVDEKTPLINQKTAVSSPTESLSEGKTADDKVPNAPATTD